MENIGNVNNYENITSQDSSDESLYYSLRGSAVLPSDEEFDNHSYLSESDSLSVYSGIYEPVIGQVNPTTYPATANYIEVLGIFPVELTGTTYYQPLFYYVPVYNDTDYSSSDSDAYYTAQESQSYFDSDESDYEAEEFGCFSETNVEMTSFESFEFSPNEDFDLSEDKMCLPSESPKDNYEEEVRDNIELQNENNFSSADIGSNNIDKHHPSYIEDINERNIFSETNVETASFESFEFSPNDDIDLSEDNEYLASESPKDNYEEEVRDNIELQNESNFSSADIGSNNIDKHHPSYIEDINERNNFSETNVETASFESFEFSPNDDIDLSEDNEYLPSESPKDNYEEEVRDNIELQNESNFSSADIGSNNIDKHHPSYIEDINERNNFSETNVETASFESFEFSPNDDIDLSEDNEYLASESQKDNYEEEDRDNSEQQNESKCTSADIGSNKVDKHHPSYIGDINERNNFLEECSINAFDFESVNSKYCQNHGLKKFNSFDDLSGKKQGQSLKKHKSLEKLSQFEDDEIYEKDYQRENTEIGMDNYDQSKKSLSFDPDDFEEDLTEEEVKYAKDQIYLRALSGKLYQKTHIPSVAILPTIYEENECFDETDEELSDLEASCLNGNQAVLNSSLCNVFEPSDENPGLLNGSLCNLFEPSDENEEIFEESQQKPKKKKMKRLREFLARIFCCVKPP